MLLSVLAQAVLLGAGAVAAKRTPLHHDQPHPPRADSDDCKCLPADDCWPGEAEWDKLDEAVGGRLHVTVPLGQPCHGDAYDEDKCEHLQAEWLYSTIQYVSENPTSPTRQSRVAN